MDKKEYGAVDVVKFICAVIVVAGHCYLADVSGFAWYTRLVELAVQIFFVFSGYFLVAAGTLGRAERMVSYVRHLFAMTVIWMVPYFLLNLLITDKSTELWVYDFTKLWTEFLSAFNSGHLWYLQNLLIVVVVLYGLGKKSFSGKELLLWLAISSVCYGRITRAVIGIAAGIYLAECKNRPDFDARDTQCVPGAGYTRRDKLLVGGIGGIVVAFLGIFAICGLGAAKEIFTNFMVNALSILLAYAVLCVKQKKSGGVHYVYLRKQSTLIYLSHLLFVPVVARVINRLFSGTSIVQQQVVYCAVLTLAVLACSVVFGSVVLVLAKKKPFHWLKRLY